MLFSTPAAVQWLCHGQPFVTSWTTTYPASLLLLVPWVCSNSCHLSQWCHPTISSSVAPFFSCPQSFPTSGSFPVSWLFTSGGQSIRASASAISLSNEQSSWLPLGLTGLISLLSKGLSRVFSSTTVRKHQFLSTQPSLWSNSHICTFIHISNIETLLCRQRSI